MEFLRLHSAQDTLFSEAFALYESSFPAYERRRLAQQTAAMADSDYHFDVILEGGIFAGIMLHWDCSGYTYIEHFAICPSMRGNALGSSCLKAFCKEHGAVILEIDPPNTPIAIRREGFYQRLGFHSNSYPHVHPAYQRQYAPHELVLMSYPKQLTESQYQVFQKELKEIVMRYLEPIEA